jgi:RNA polymerase sigma-70 factor (ECF subfamily)
MASSPRCVESLTYGFRIAARGTFAIVKEEVALLEAWKAGDRAAGDELLAKIVPAVRRFFRNKVAGEVDELTQQVVLDCVRSLDAFEGRSSFRTYALAIARRRLMAFYRERAQTPGVDIDQLSIAEMAESPSSVRARKQEHTFLLQALREVPLELQVVLELHYWEALSTQEIAEVLDIPRGTVKSRLRRAREAVAVRLRSLDPKRERVDDMVGRFDEWAASLRELLER